ncbi:MAG TPA: hypothetical protein VK835_03250 [Bacteroidia bacterium]|jgi:hypothetical protein|nr:hypothetical protein [Bacteroidia bacterium]
MKKIVFVFFIFFLSAGAYSQTTKMDSLLSKQPAKKVKTYLSAAVGASLPVSDFALKDINNPGSGFASLGYNINASLAWLFKKGWGISLLYRYQSNDLDKVALAQQYNTKYPSVKFDIVSTPWKVNAFMLGSYNSFPISESKDTYFDCKVMLGVVRSTSFGMTLTGKQGSGSATVTSPTASANAFGYCLGLGIHHQIARELFVGFNVDYFQTTVNYGEVAITASNGATTPNTLSQKIGTVNLSLSIICRVD